MKQSDPSKKSEKNLIIIKFDSVVSRDGSGFRELCRFCATFQLLGNQIVIVKDSGYTKGKQIELEKRGVQFQSSLIPTKDFTEKCRSIKDQYENVETCIAITSQKKKSQEPERISLLEASESQNAIKIVATLQEAANKIMLQGVKDAPKYIISAALLNPVNFRLLTKLSDKTKFFILDDGLVSESIRKQCDQHKFQFIQKEELQRESEKETPVYLLSDKKIEGLENSTSRSFIINLSEFALFLRTYNKQIEVSKPEQNIYTQVYAAAQANLVVVKESWTSWLLQWMIAAGTAAPFAIYAWLGPVNAGPDKLIPATAKMSPGQLVEAMTFGGSSFITNTPMNKVSIVPALQKLGKFFSGLVNRKVEKVKLGAVWFGLCATVVNFALGWDSLANGSKLLQIIFSCLTILPVMTTRFNAVDNLLSRMFLADVKTQRTIIAKLKNLKNIKEIQDIVIDMYTERGERKKVEEALTEFMQAVFKEMEAKGISMPEKSTADMLARAFDIAMVLLVTMIFSAWAEKGSQALEIIAPILKDNSTWKNICRIPAGYIVGSGSMLFYWVNSFDIRDTLTTWLSYYYEQYQKQELTIVEAAKGTLIIPLILSGMAMQKIVQDLISVGKYAYIGIYPDTPAADVFRVQAFEGGFNVNGGVVLKYVNATRVNPNEIDVLDIDNAIK